MKPKLRNKAVYNKKPKYLIYRAIIEQLLDKVEQNIVICQWGAGQLRQIINLWDTGRIYTRDELSI